MNLSLSKSQKKIKTQPSVSSSLPRLRLQSCKTIYHQPKLNPSLIELRKFPEVSPNPEIILKKTMINLNMVKRISTLSTQSPSFSKKILPHPIATRKSFTKLTGLQKQKQKVLEQDNIVHITAQKWLIYDCAKSQPVKGYKYKKQHDVASLSKILTWYTVFMIVKQYNLGIDKIDLMVMKEDQQLGGTTVNIKNQNIITLEDALYAMMLNSANNAATVLANNLGFLCLRKRQNKYFSCFDINESNRRNNIEFFVSLMRKFAQKLQLKDTQIQNPHGMSGNISTCKDIARLFQTCWKFPLFRKILQTKQRPIKVKYVDEKGNLCLNEITLKTTNKMDKYNIFCKGGKTGQNKIGGNNFVSYFEEPIKGKKYIIVVLGCFGRQEKFKDTDRLYEWVHIENK